MMRLIALCVLLACGCRSIPFPQTEPRPATDHAWHLRPQLRRAVGRAVLLRGESQFDFTLLVKFDSAANLLHVAGVEDLGGTLLQASCSATGEVDVVRSSRLIPERFVEELALVLRAFCVGERSGAAQAVGLEDGLGLQDALGNWQTLLTRPNELGFAQRAYVGEGRALHAQLDVRSWSDAGRPLQLELSFPALGIDLDLNIVEWESES